MIGSGLSAAMWFVVTACVIGGWGMPPAVQGVAAFFAGIGALDRFMNKYEESYR